MRAANRASQKPRWQDDADVQSKIILTFMEKSNRESARAKVTSVEEDLWLGPIVQEELYYHSFVEDAPSDATADEVRILASVYKYRVLVEQLSTSAAVWGVLREYSHAISVEISRRAIDKALGTNDSHAIAQAIKERFSGPHAIQHFAAFCRSTAEYFTIHEDGPQRDNLIARMCEKE